MPSPTPTNLTGTPSSSTTLTCGAEGRERQGGAGRCGLGCGKGSKKCPDTKPSQFGEQGSMKHSSCKEPPKVRQALQQEVQVQAQAGRAKCCNAGWAAPALCAHHCAAARGAVQLSEDEAAELDCLVELLGLVEHVEPGGAIQHQQHLQREGRQAGRRAQQAGRHGGRGVGWPV